MYSEAFVRDLAGNWITKQEAMKVLGMTDVQVYHWAKKYGIERVVIGKASLIRSSAVYFPWNLKLFSAKKRT